MLKSILILLFYLRISFAKDNFDVLSYNISINFAYPSLMYTGTVDIGMKFHEGFAKIRIPRGDYEITATRMRPLGSMVNQGSPMMHDPVQPDDEYFVFNNRSVKTQETQVLWIEFRGSLPHDDKELYHSKYLVPNNAFAGFKGQNGHRFVPCFDDFSTRANVTVKFENSSMFTVSIQKDRSTRHWHHEITEADQPNLTDSEYKAIPMYMLGLVVGKFQLVANVTDENRSFDLVTTNELASLDEDKLFDECIATISTTFVWLETFFNVTSLAKLNITVFMPPEALPNLVDSKRFIYYPIQSVLNMHKTLEDKHNFRLITAKKMARMYLANLLHPEKGKDFWVDHGLSNYLQYKVMGGLYTEYNFEQLMFLESRYHALKEDHYPGVENLDSESVSEHFARRKGGSLFWMLESVLTEETFKTFMNHFILLHREKSINESHLADAFKKFTSEIPNAQSSLDMLSFYTNQTDYPIIRIHRATGNDIQVTQQLLGSRFESLTHRWVVPVKLPEKDLFWAREKFLLFHTNDWKLANLGVQGYYRVDYDERIWTDIINKLKSNDSYKDITTLNRARLIDDSLNLAIAHSAPYTYALQILDYLEHEDEYLPWAIVYENLKYLLPKIHRTKGENVIETKVGKHAWTVYRKKIATSETNFIVDKFIKLLLDLACYCGNQDCLDFLKNNYTEPSLVNIGMHDRHTSCCYAARASNVFADKVYDAFNTSSDQDAKNFYLECAACDKRYNETIEKWNQTLKPCEMNQFLQHMISKSHGHEDVVRKFIWRAEQYCSDSLNENCDSRDFKTVIQSAVRYIVDNIAIPIYSHFLTGLTSLKLPNSEECKIITNDERAKITAIINENVVFRQQQSDAIIGN